MADPRTSRRAHPSPGALTLVLFGPVGDLAERMLLPALWHAHRTALLPDAWRLVGTARSPMSDDEFRQIARKAVLGDDSTDCDDWADFAGRLTYCAADLVDDDGVALADAIAAAEHAGAGTRLHYLSTPPPTFGPVTHRLGELGLLDDARVVFEKPYGMDLASFDELEATVTGLLDDDRIFRLDHFLGKRSVQELVGLRATTPALEQVWSSEHVRRVEIDVPETLGVGDRAGFYDDTGVLRDVVSTHLIQVASVVAMTLPDGLDDVAAARTAALATVRPIGADDVVFGQYDGYLDVDGVDDSSTTETFAAVTMRLDDPRWSGVPFDLRHGKRMGTSHQRLTISFEPDAARRLDAAGLALDGDALVIDLDRPETVPVGPAHEDRAESAHERLLLAAIAGDGRWFPEAAPLRHVWQHVDGVLADPPTVHPYVQGTAGPEAARDLVAPRRWTT